MENRKGKLITFEGPEGGGKTTQISMLSDYLKSQGYSVVLTREPGGTGIGISIRNILLDPSFTGICSRAELLLFLADRAQHVSDVIEPALIQGKIVLCDRYIDSTIAYQVGGRHFPEDLITLLNNFSSYEVTPDLTYLLDVDFSIGIKRATKVAADRFEREDRDFHERIKRKYLELLEKFPERIKRLDTTKDHMDSIQMKIRQIFCEAKILKNF